MTDKNNICNDCQNEMDVYEKDDYVRIIYPCEYCKQEAIKLARMCNEGMKKINAGLQLREVVEMLGRAQKAAREGR
jgi:hypothetical protein